MTKSIIITYNEADEGFLMTFFNKIKVKTSLLEPMSEIDIVRQRLHDKYVVTGEWATMNDDEREDAAHAETMIYAKEQPDYHVYTADETNSYRQQLREKLIAHADH